MRKLYCILLSLLIFTACETSEKETDGVIEFTGGTLTSQTIYADETQKLAGIQFKARDKWSAKITQIKDAKGVGSDVDWLSLNVYEGKAGDNSITLNFSLNTTGLERKAEIKITCGNSAVIVVVAQAAVTQAGEAFVVVQIPDAAFKAYLLEFFDENENGEMESTEMSNIREIYIVNPEIKSIEGIEYCTNLGSAVIQNTTIEIFDFNKFCHIGRLILDCPQVKNVKIISASIAELMLLNLTEDTNVDLTSCVNLTNISFSRTNPNHVDLSKYPNLKYLGLQETNIKTLDLSKFPSLEGFWMHKAEVSELTMSNPNLTSFVFENSKAPIIDLSASEKLNSDNVSIYGENYIERIDFGNLKFSTERPDKVQLELTSSAQKLTVISKNLTSLLLGGTRVNELNLSDCSSLTWLALNDCSFDATDPRRAVIEGALTLKALDLLTRISMSWSGLNELNIADSKGVEGLVIDGHAAKSFKLIGAGKMSNIEFWNSTKVESVDISGSLSLKKLESYYMEALKTLDVSGCTSLEEASVSHSKTLDLFNLKGCSSLKKLFCTMNGIKVLDVEGCSSLAQLWCSANQMKTLDLSTCDIFNDSYMVPDFYPLQCLMSSLETLYLKSDWKINGINVYRKDEYIHSATKIEYK